MNATRYVFGLVVDGHRLVAIGGEGAGGRYARKKI